MPGAVADGVHGAENGHQHHQQDNNGNDGERRHAAGRGGICSLLADQHMELAEERQGGPAVVPGVYVLRHGAVHKAGGLGRQAVVEGAAGHHGVVAAAHGHEQDRVIGPQFQGVRPAVGRVLHIAGDGVHRHHRQDAPHHAVPVGVVEVDGLLLGRGQHIGLVHQIGGKGGGGEGLVQGLPALGDLHLWPLGQPVQRGEEDRGDHNGDSHPFFLQ